MFNLKDFDILWYKNFSTQLVTKTNTDTILTRKSKILSAVAIDDATQTVKNSRGLGPIVDYYNAELYIIIELLIKPTNATRLL